MRLFGRRQGLLFGSAGAVAVLCLALLPVAPRLGFALQADACDAFGACRTAELMTGACTADTRSSVSGQARTPVYFEQVAPGEAGLRFFADGTAGVVAEQADGPQSHRFPTGEAALRWLVARNPAEAAAVDQAWGPAATGQTEAVLGGADALGLGVRTDAADTSAVEDVAAGGEHAVMTVAHDGGYSVHQTMTLPWGGSARLTGLAAWLGVRSHLVVRTDHSTTGVPTSVTLTGPMRTGWDLRVLTGTEPTAGGTAPEAPTADAFGLRSYTLDLTRQQNADAFAGVFTTRYGADGRTFPAPPASPHPTGGDEDGTHPVDAFADRIRSDGVLVEARYEAESQEARTLTVDAVLALMTGVPLADVPAEFAPRLTDASAMDLARPESALSPIVNCEPPDVDAILPGGAATADAEDG